MIFMKDPFGEMVPREKNCRKSQGEVQGQHPHGNYSREGGPKAFLQEDKHKREANSVGKGGKGGSGEKKGFK